MNSPERFCSPVEQSGNLESEHLHGPSHAWLIGVLCGSGNIKENGQIMLESGERELVELFDHHFSLVFPHITSRNIQTVQRDGRGEKYAFVRYSKELTAYIGSLDKKGEGGWPQTLQERYEWIFADPALQINFLSGYFDGNGSITDVPVMSFSVSHNEGSEVLKNLLGGMGVTQVYDKKSPQGQIRAVQVLSQKEVLHYIEQVTNDGVISYKRGQLLDIYGRFNEEEYVGLPTMVAYELAYYAHNVQHASFAAIQKQLKNLGYGEIVSQRLERWMSGPRKLYDQKNPAITEQEIAASLFELLLPADMEEDYEMQARHWLCSFQDDLQPRQIVKVISSIIEAASLLQKINVYMADFDHGFTLYKRRTFLDFRKLLSEFSAITSYREFQEQYRIVKNDFALLKR